MTDTPPEIQTLVESAQRLGIELDEHETAQWLAALAADDHGIVVGDEGVFGHKLSMLDFSPAELERFRRIGRIVELTGPEGEVEGALALSGSAAQSKIQSYPGDADYFQRVNILAPSREQACAILAHLLREKAVAFERGPNYQFFNANLGTQRNGKTIRWRIDDIKRGWVQTDDGVVNWDDAALNPGWVKADWVVTDPGRGRLSNASNVIDATWESPEGEIIPLDGYLDAYFQEVYLDSGELPVFAKVVRFVSDDALDDYVVALEGEVRKYLTRHLNYGKAAKRMYNVFRLSGRHLDAAFVRELFDEPATILYQVWSLIGALDNATRPGSSIPMDAVQEQADALILDVVAALEGDEEVAIVSALQRLRRTLEGQPTGEQRTAEVAAAQNLVINLVNTFFRDRLSAVPTIKEYIDQIQAEDAVP
ncbi:MAG TPA: hypothetical protein PLA50_01555 [Bacteroidia bacterium]|nr:hypothetical protein [Bacteroidia bacterium]